MTPAEWRLHLSSCVSSTSQILKTSSENVVTILLLMVDDAVPTVVYLSRHEHLFIVSKLIYYHDKTSNLKHAQVF